VDNGAAATAYGDVRRRPAVFCVNGRRRGEVKTATQDEKRAKFRRLEAIPRGDGHEIDVIGGEGV